MVENLNSCNYALHVAKTSEDAQVKEHILFALVKSIQKNDKQKSVEFLKIARDCVNRQKDPRRKISSLIHNLAYFERLFGNSRNASLALSEALHLLKNNSEEGWNYYYDLKLIALGYARNKNYKKIVEFLSKRRFATRSEILTFLKLDSGGTLSDLLFDLEQCGFIERYTPFDKPDSSLLARYCILDAYIQFYIKFIKPIEKNIDAGIYNKTPTGALKIDTYRQWLGYSFERLCRKNHVVIAKILGFQEVSYKVGTYYNRASEKALPGFQIDLIFDRADQVYTVCEIKLSQAKIGMSVVSEFEKKLSLFPNPKSKTIQKVLISAEGAEKPLIHAGYFDNIITINDLFNPRYW